MEDRTILEVEALYALHRAGACLGEPVEVERTGDGKLRIVGVTRTSERKDELIAALTPLADPRLLVELKSAKEMLAELDTSTIAGMPSADTPSVPANRRKLVKTLAKNFGGDERAAQAFLDKSLSLGEEMMQQAQALRHLALRFGPPGGGLPLRSAWLVEVMLRDHLENLRTKTAETQRHLESGLGASARLAPDLGASPASIPDESWALTVLRVFDAAKQATDGLRHALLTQNSVPLTELSREASLGFVSLEQCLQSISEHELAPVRQTPAFTAKSR